MKKTTKTLFSLLLVLVMVFQFGAVAPMARAEGDLPDSARVNLIVLAPLDKDGNLTTFGDVDVLDSEEIRNSIAEATTVGTLKSEGIVLTPPEGFGVDELYVSPTRDDTKFVQVTDEIASFTDLEENSSAEIAIFSSFFSSDMFDNMSPTYGLYVKLAPAEKIAAKAATCVKAGNEAYFKVGDELYLIDAEPVIPATGEHTLEAVEAKDATCTDDGVKAHYKCSVCGKLFDGNGEDKQEITADNAKITALTHNWGEPTYVWSDDNRQCTATRVCTRDASHKETETVDAAVVSTATCEAAGTVTYTATFTNPAFAKQDKTDNVDALGHDYTTSYDWSDDFSQCTATAQCSRDDSHKVVETVNATSSTTKAATCEAKGEITYTATFTNALFATQTKVKEVSALGHDWKAPTYSWSVDFSECTAQRLCKNGDKEVETVKSVPTYTATCTEAGTVTYTATFENLSFEPQTSSAVTQAALGHDWGEPTYTWSSDYSSVTATVACKRDPSHTETETVKTTNSVTKAATATTDGERTFSAAFTKAPFTLQTKIVAIDKSTTPGLKPDSQTTWTPGSKDGFKLHIDATFDESLKDTLVVKVGDTVVPKDKYTVTSGSVTVTIDPSYMNSLPAGTHTVSVTFPSGNVVTTPVTIPAAAPGVTALSFTVDSTGWTKTYDGKAFDLEGLKNYITVVSLPSGYKADVEILFEDPAVTELHNAGTAKVKLHLKAVKDGAGNDVTAAFTCEDMTGLTLTINPRKIGVETRDDSKVYDGKAWTYTHMSNAQPIMTYTDAKLGEYVRDGKTYVQTISIKYTASPKNMGVYENKAELIIREKEKGSSDAGTDVTANYEITYKFGKIKITDSKGNVPNSGVKTGDENNLWIWVGVMAAAAVVIVVLLFVMRKNKKNTAPTE